MSWLIQVKKQWDIIYNPFTPIIYSQGSTLKVPSLKYLVFPWSNISVNLELAQELHSRAVEYILQGHHVKCWNDGTCTRKEQVLPQGTKSPGEGESEKKNTFLKNF